MFKKMTLATISLVGLAFMASSYAGNTGLHLKTSFGHGSKATESIREMSVSFCGTTLASKPVSEDGVVEFNIDNVYCDRDNDIPVTLIFSKSATESVDADIKLNKGKTGRVLPVDFGQQQVNFKLNYQTNAIKVKNETKWTVNLYSAQ